MNNLAASKRLICTATLLVALCAPTVAIAQFVFDPAVNTALADSPDGVAAGDWDGDLDIDLAIAADNPDRVVIYFNTGDGTFGAPVDVPTGAGTGPGYVREGDLDGDLDLDLVVALQNSDSVLILLNNGSGTFTSGGTFAVGSNPRGIVIGRLDGDADWDLAVVNRDSNNISILLNNGDATFGAASTFGVGEDPRGIAGGDFDGDADMDLAVTNHDDRTVSILTNNGAGSFTTSATLSVGGGVRPDGIDAGDLDGDSDMDLAVAISGTGANFAAIFLNDGAGGFTGPTNFAVGGVNPSTLRLADLDCDDDLDVVTLNQDSGNISLLANDGSASFGAATLLAVGTNPEHVIAADLDGDADWDLVISNRDSNNWSSLINLSCAGGATCGDGSCDPGEDQCNCPEDCGAPPSTETDLCNDGMDNDCDGLTDCDDADCAAAPNCATGGFDFDSAVSIAAAERPAGVAPGDFDGDGDEDMAVSTDNPDKLSIYTNNGDGTFAGPVTVLLGAGTGAGFVVARDLDGDNDLDLAVALHNANSVRVVTNDGSGVFTAGATFAVDVDPRHIVAGDFDGDTDVDLATVNRSANSVSILLNDGSGGFAAAVNVAVGLDPRAAAGGDFDGDTDFDLAVTNHDDRTVSILSNNGSGTFTETATLAVNPAVRPDGIATSDLDGDGDQDLAVATSSAGLNFASIFLNDGTGGFAGPTDYPVDGTNPGSIVAVDLDCDGDPDLATANSDSNDVSVLPNSGLAVFGLPMVVAVGVFPEHVASADFDGNGINDLVTANRDSDDVSLLLGQACVLQASGDWEPDGDQDLGDFAAFQVCFSGAASQVGFVMPSQPCRDAFDFNGDTDVDLTDLTVFTGLMTGPN